MKEKSMYSVKSIYIGTELCCTARLRKYDYGYDYGYGYDYDYDYEKFLC
jgi:hypothetical protein